MALRYVRLHKQHSCWLVPLAVRISNNMPGGTNNFETSNLRLLQDAMLHKSGKLQYP